MSNARIATQSAAEPAAEPATGPEPAGAAFEARLRALEAAHAGLIARPNERIEEDGGVFERYRYPALTAEHTRNAVLHPEWVEGCYAFYTRPQDGFIDAGTGGGIGFGLCDDIERPEIRDERIIVPRRYHTVGELKNGQGPPPIRTRGGWLHLAHGARTTAAGLRYVLYVFVTDPSEPWRVRHSAGGYLIAPEGDERIGDVPNVVFCNGWIADDDGTVYIYYASSDTRIHVATTSIERLRDYVESSPPDSLRTAAAVEQRYDLIRRNLQLGRRF